MADTSGDARKPEPVACSSRRGGAGWAVAKALGLALVSAWLLSGSELTAQRSAPDPTGYDVMRVETEFKLNVPEDRLDDVWEFLTARYASPSEFLLRLDPSLVTRESVEYFVDRYFDSDDLVLLELGGGIRHRTRYTPGDTTNSKHERELLQVKLPLDGEEATHRSEVKFPIAHYSTIRTPLDTHPLIGLVDRSWRNDLMDRVMEAGIEPTGLRMKVRLEQTRRRVYVSRRGEDIATMTLDTVTSRKWWRRVVYHVLEIEINEVTYTLADPETRKELTHIQEALKADIQSAFPELVLDPLPKYQRTYAAQDAEFLLFPMALKYGVPMEALALVMAVFVGILGMVGLRKAEPTGPGGIRRTAVRGTPARDRIGPGARISRKVP